ncbi:hypothetical protein AB205_0061660 [Aquarana catesbeiana]|uniref:Myb/SANT-like DNA-binding domain-containing protein n=1 Tax=Aquarana catesbeiana TaxID=8400 RepID=A0A2G9Q5R2_AQUCT|nr:hypothetical protein AB205_0061660 [Aquarana catesbeiana]
MRVTPPAPDVLSSLFPAPFRSAQWGKSTWRRHSRIVLIVATRRRRRRKGRIRTRPNPEGDLRTQICMYVFGEMLEMVDILKKADYDGKKAKIMAKVVRSLHWKFGVRRSKDQLRKRWLDLKLREHEQYRTIRRVLQKSK